MHCIIAVYHHNSDKSHIAIFNNTAMSTLTFSQPDTCHRQTVLELLHAFEQTGNIPIHGGDELHQFGRDYAAWLDYVYAPAATNRFGYAKVPSSIYLALRGTQAVGIINLRHQLNDFLMQHGGHIGYSTHPNCQGQGIATAMTTFGITVLRTLGTTDILITCQDSNRASARVIEKCGGILENTVMGGNGAIRRYWIRQA